ncbi:MAG: hypothetical protein HY786_03850 [Deltaproteobacteria bacterium]|nr:hypothetical protein [Deltaproteobacteria bacterium]
MKSEQSTMSSYAVSAAIVAIVASGVLPNTQITGYNLLQNSLLSSATSSYVKSVSMRSARVQALRGKYAFVPTSSEEFASRKQKEIEQGLA